VVSPQPLGALILPPSPSVSEFNHERDADGECLLVPGLQALSDDDSCKGDDDYWYERTAYRKIPHSSCEGGMRLDRGSPHIAQASRHIARSSGS
jgi:hypothetical protein